MNLRLASQVYKVSRLDLLHCRTIVKNNRKEINNVVDQLGLNIIPSLKVLLNANLKFPGIESGILFPYYWTFYFLISFLNTYIT